MHLKAVICQPAQANQKSHRAASAEAGGFRIHIQDSPGIKHLRHFFFTHQGKGIPCQLQGTGELLRRPVYGKMAAVPCLLLRAVSRTVCSGAADCPQLIPEVHFVSSFSRRIAVRLPSSPISPTGPTQEGHP